MPIFVAGQHPAPGSNGGEVFHDERAPARNRNERSDVNKVAYGTMNGNEHEIVYDYRIADREVFLKDDFSKWINCHVLATTFEVTIPIVRVIYPF